MLWRSKLYRPPTPSPIQYLSDQLELPKPKRRDSRYDLGSIPGALTDDILDFMNLMRTKLEIPLTPTYFRVTRPKFVDQLFEDVREGRICFLNAVNKAVTYAGSEKSDHKDMILALARWPNLAREVAKKLGVNDQIPTFHRPDPYLDAPTTCRKWLHEQQRHEMMFILRNKKDFDMMSMMVEDPNNADSQFFIVDVVRDENPIFPKQMVGVKFVEYELLVDKRQGGCS